ncbi:MAG: four-carbon acid sugar kinase family protein [Nisaea sp.]|uniref:3-oxo-tetronate kinase n=1 Tax=Nisaea sp. TaxID=2024842 RepID=UPI001B05A11A|nr:3-oxo-tetronate kinase [Nisaea sp.]MBO6561400.1 four-carbon acid sugar kinase family protein [Nisaea sp.]
MAPILGCIADDFTGATDLANMLVRGGMRTVQLIGVPATDTPVPDVDAVVVALKSRTNPADEAVAQSLQSLQWLKAAGCRQFFFKYCSTFDSTDDGNIGPVADALMADLGTTVTIACPAFPENGRTIFNGHLFVGTQLLSDSPMRNHPLTPMTDSNLVSVLQRQTKKPVKLIQFATVDAGGEAVAAELAALKAAGGGIAIVDAVLDKHLESIGYGVKDLPLITGGSGIAIGLPGNYRRAGLLAERGAAGALPQVRGSAAVLAGSCSAATLGQIARFEAGHPSFAVDALRLARGEDVVAEALGWAAGRIADGPVLIYASQPAEKVREIQKALGRAEAGALIEEAMAAIARGLVASGTRRLVVAGGETSGAVVSALGIEGLQIGPQIDPGVPATVSLGGEPLALALKSGNFGGPDFFAKALASMP